MAKDKRARVKLTIEHTLRTDTRLVTHSRIDVTAGEIWASGYELKAMAGEDTHLWLKIPVSEVDITVNDSTKTK